jgi:hypothetical protein
MPGADYNLHDFMAEVATNTLFGGDFDRDVVVRPYGVVANAFTLRGLFRQPQNALALMQSSDGEEAVLNAVLTVPAATDLQDRDVVVVDGIEWRVHGIAGSDGTVSTYNLTTTEHHRTRRTKGS